MDGDLEMLRRIAQKWCEPLDTDTDRDKTIGQWRKELASLLSEAVTYVSSRHIGDGRC